MPRRRFAEQPLDALRQAYLAHAGLACDERPQLRAASGDPFAYRHGEAALARKALGQRRMLREPAPQQPFAVAAPDLEIVGKTEGKIRDIRVEKGRSAFDSMRHQATIELAEKVVGQPIRAIRRLGDLQPAASRRRRMQLRTSNSVAPAGKIAAE